MHECLISFRAGHMAKSEDLHCDKTHYELRRQYHCMAYNMLISVITCTQNKMQFYNGFLFKEDVTKVKNVSVFVRPICTSTMIILLVVLFESTISLNLFQNE